ncbi:MAG: hypothetical protein ACRD2Z_14315 [Thermoanaerobaculia bacterium]
MRHSRLTRNLTLLALGLWLAAAVVGGATGAINQPDAPPLLLGAYILLPIGVFVAAYAMSASFRAFTERLSLTWMVGAHVWRFVGLGFVLGWLSGALPAGFALPAGLGDVAAALGALLLVPALRKGAASRGRLLAWNVFGFVDLVAALVLGNLYSSASTGVLATGSVTTESMVTFPVSLIPTFLVPLFLLLHGLTFKRIASPEPPPRHGARHGAR